MTRNCFPHSYINFMLAFVFLYLPRVAAEEEISFVIACDKDTFLVGEDINVTIDVRNNTEKTLEVFDALITTPAAFQIELTDDSGKKYQFRFTSSEQPMSKCQLRPHETLSHFYTINHWYGETDPVCTLIGRLGPSRYSLEIHYYPHGKSLNAYKQTINFTVVKPPASEVPVSELFLKAQRNYNHKLNESVTLLESIVLNHEGSAYRAKALSMLIGASIETRDFGKGMRYLELLLNQYPNSIFAWEGLLRYSSKMDRIEKLKLFEKIRRKHSQEKIGERVSSEISRSNIK